MNLSLTRRQFVVSLAALSVTGCKHPATALQFGHIVALGASLPQLAQSQGYFTREHVQVATIQESSGAVVIQQMNSVQNPLDLGVEGMPAVCAMIGQNHVRPVVIATIGRSNRTIKLLTFAKTGITDSPATLRSRRVGYTSSTVSHEYLTNLLAKAGMQITDVRGFSAPQPALIDNLLHGDLDAAVLWDPGTTLAIRKYSQRLQAGSNVDDRGQAAVFTDPSLLNVTTHIVARPEVISQRRSDVIGFLRALIDAETYLNTSKAAAQGAIEAWLKVTAGDLQEDFATSDYRVGLEINELTSSMQASMAWLKTQNPKAIMPSAYAQFIDASLLREIDATRVTG